MSLIISFDSVFKDIKADNQGNYQLTIFGFATGYTGPAELVIFDDNTEKTYASLTNELGAVGFKVSGVLPEGETKKSYPVLLSTPFEQQKSFFTVKAR